MKVVSGHHHVPPPRDAGPRHFERDPLSENESTRHARHHGPAVGRPRRRRRSAAATGRISTPSRTNCNLLMPVREPPTTDGQRHESRRAEKGCPAPGGDPLAAVKGVVNAILIT